MCTVIFTPRRQGYALGMNRDEQRTRVAGQAPRRQTVAGRKMIFPSEPGGGTWVGVNDAGVALALINWYAVAAEVTDPPVSRGLVVRETLSADRPDAVEARLRELPLDRLRPFRLIGFFPDTETAREWLWDRRQLDRLTHPWRAGIWISSGHDEPGAQVVRERVFQQAQREPGAGSLAWLRRLLRSHLPTAGAYSICMHRTDAVTVSQTEIQVSRGAAHLRYHSGSPCEGKTLNSVALTLPGAPSSQPKVGELEPQENPGAPRSRRDK